MICFHFGIHISINKEVLIKNKKAWNTLCIEVFELALILIPATAVAGLALIIVTCGSFAAYLRTR